MYIETIINGIRMGVTAGDIVIPMHQGFAFIPPVDIGKAVMEMAIRYAFVESALCGDVPDHQKAPRTPTEKRRHQFSKKRPMIIGMLAERDGYICAYPDCEDRGNLTIDHIIPISKGGTDDLDNLQLLCKKHNSSKRDR